MANETAPKSRFGSLSEAELESILDEKDSKRTKSVINNSESIFSLYCGTKGIEFAQLAPREMDGVLRTFYAEVRQSNGELYAKRSMISLRYGLQRYFLKHRQIDICKDEEFQGSSEMFKAVLHKLKAEGKGAIRHKDPITPEDMEKIRQSLNIRKPSDLQDKVFMDLMLHLCNRGRENLRQMRKEDFTVVRDSVGQRYVHVARDMITKNHRGEKDDNEQSQGGRMYETGESDCPVKSFIEYISHLNENCNALWQRPKKREDLSKPLQGPWYDNVPVGVNTLGNKVSVISKKANCSKVYTNHCLRATAINKLDNAGFQARHIMSISGHKSESSIKHYSRVEESQKRRMSMTIASNNLNVEPEETASKPRPSTSSTRPRSSTCTVTAVPVSPPQNQLALSQQSSPVNINTHTNTSVSSQTQSNLHFHHCKVKVIYQK